METSLWHFIHEHGNKLAGVWRFEGRSWNPLEDSMVSVE